MSTTNWLTLPDGDKVLVQASWVMTVRDATPTERGANHVRTRIQLSGEQLFVCEDKKQVATMLDLSP